MVFILVCSSFGQVEELLFQIFSSMIWSICCTTNEQGRKKLEVFIREKETVFPLKDTVYDYYVDHTNYSISSWEDRLPYGWKYETG